MTLQHRRLAGAAPTTCSPRRNAIPGRPTSTATRASRSVPVVSPMTPLSRPTLAGSGPTTRQACTHPQEHGSPSTGEQLTGRGASVRRALRGRPPRGPRAAATHRGNMRWTGGRSLYNNAGTQAAAFACRHRAEHGGQDSGRGSAKSFLKERAGHS